MRRFLLLAVVIVLLANLAAVTTKAVDEPVVPVTVAALPAEDLPPVVPDRLTTTTTVATTVPTSRPVDPPTNAYADEPHVVIGTIEIPKLGLSVPLNQGISLKSIDRGPSHWPGTALPGNVGNVVVAGHRVTHSKPFRHIDSLAVGDEIIYVVDGVRSVYAVTGNEVVTPDATWIVNQTQEATTTLFACHPPGSARYRFVVYGKLVSSTPV
ncbi:MAG TPA: class E sortase [Acidimicrobiales bacterium]|nr:class E sortase [Acidimicrobiales bacterium]